MSTTFCLDCDRAIDLGYNPRVGQRVICPRCETKLEIINLDPLELDWVYDGPTVKLNIFDQGWDNSELSGWKA